MNWRNRMASTGSSTKPLSFAISYGFLGGPLHSRRFRKLLHKAGYIQANSPEKADIIIAHSAGCRLLPETSKPKLLIFVGMPLTRETPYETFKKARRSNVINMIRDFNFLRMLSIGFISFYYGMFQPRRNRAIIRGAKTPVVMNLVCSHTIFIANRDDPWPDPAQLPDYAMQHNWTFIGLTGSHDDIWEHEDHYLDIINHYAGLLGQADA